MTWWLLLCSADTVACNADVPVTALHVYNATRRCWSFMTVDDDAG